MTCFLCSDVEPNTSLATVVAHIATVHNTVQGYLDHVGKDQHCSQSLGFYIVMEYNVYKCNVEVTFTERLSPKSFKPRQILNRGPFHCYFCDLRRLIRPTQTKTRPAVTTKSENEALATSAEAEIVIETPLKESDPLLQ